MRRAVLSVIVTLLACTTAAPQGGGAKAAVGVRERAPATPAEAAAPCDSMSRTTCMRSTHCTLVRSEGAELRQYQCRAATSPCEVGFAQASVFGAGAAAIAAGERQQAECRERVTCHFEPGSCYCACRGNGKTTVPDGAEADGCLCECSGGPPPTCTRAPAG
ncbi:MAG: hypothetical protein AAF721_40480 [Myxococcota bacterium]